MITAQEIYAFIDSFAPFDTAMDFDNVGILVGSPQASSDKVMLALDATQEVIREAVESAAGILVTHHPIIFRPLKRLSAEHPVYQAAGAGLTVISAHTNLDIALGGVNDMLMKQVGLTPVMPTNTDCCALGKLPEAMEDTRFASVLQQRLACEGVRYIRRQAPIKTVAVACGAGGSNIDFAIRSGADALITGEIKHHELLLAKAADIAVFDIGHFTSEKWIIPHITELLTAQFPQAQFRASQTEHNGYEYYTPKGETYGI